MRTYRYLPGKYMEVVTFEVKPKDAINVTAVYEALAHLRSATHAYVIFHVPDDQDESVKLTIDEACHVGRRHGVGLIVMGDPGDFDMWEEREEAQRVEPDPQRLDEFIATQRNTAQQLDGDATHQILGCLKGEYCDWYPFHPGLVHGVLGTGAGVDFSEATHPHSARTSILP